MLKPRKPLILASASPRREILLRQLGLDFEVRPSYAEDGAVIELQHPAAYARAAAELKAEVIAAEISSGYVIGADTIVVQEGRILGSPKTTRTRWRFSTICRDTPTRSSPVSP